MRSLLLAVPFCCVASLAPAQTASVEGAQALKSLLQTYFGATDGVVSVNPVGGSYSVTLDFAPLAAKAGPDVAIAVTPLQMQLSQLGNGTWSMTQDQSFDLSIKAPDADIQVSLGNLTSKGTFDEALGTFSSSTTTAKDIKVYEKITMPAATPPDPSEPPADPTEVTYTIASMIYESQARAGGAGGVDSTGTYSLEGLSEAFTAPPFGQFQLNAATSNGSFAVDGLRPDAFYQLIAFFVANPDEAMILAKQGELKSIIKDGMPLFAHLTTSSAMNGLSLQSPFGLFEASEVSVTVALNGLIEDGLFREAITLKGLSIPVGLVPDWASDLVPSDVALDFSLSQFNPAAAVLAAIERFDPSKQPTPEDDEAMVKALLPSGEALFSLAPGSVTAPLYGLTYEGKIAFGPATTIPAGTARITATGMTAVRQALTKAPPEIGMQAGPALGMAEGMAKQGENGALVWELELTPEGEVKVNGVDMSGIGGN